MAKRKQPSQPPASPANKTGEQPAHVLLLDDVRTMIQQAREATAQAVNSALVLLYWQVGRRLEVEVLAHRRAAYGEQVVRRRSPIGGRIR